MLRNNIKTITLNNFEEFEKIAQDMIDNKLDNSSNILFRGQSNSKWSLQSTLERLQKQVSVNKYCKILEKIKLELEKYTSKIWKLNCLSYTDSKFSSIYAYQEYENKDNSKGGLDSFPFLYNLTKDIETHERHILQEAEYTICRQTIKKEQYYVPYKSGFRKNMKKQDICKKYLIPSTERLKVLNRFTLFNDLDSLSKKLYMDEFILSGDLSYKMGDMKIQEPTIDGNLELKL